MTLGAPGAPSDILGNVEILRRLPLFAGLEERDLVRICGMARRQRFAAGERVMRQGDPGDGMYVIVDGELEVSTREGGGEVALGVRGPGEFVGEMSLLGQAPRSASVRALRESELLVVSPEEFQELLAANPGLAASLLRTVTARLRDTEASLMERERLASLGTLSAGLAHELNNPASAVRRATAHLREALAARQEHAAALWAGGGAGAWEGLRELAGVGSGGEAGVVGSGEVRATPADGSSSMSGADSDEVREEALARWLERRGLPRPWELAPVLLGAGWDARRIEAELEPLAPERLPSAVGWLAAEIEVRELLDRIDQGTRLISEIVQAVKAYSYMDRAPVQEVELRDTLEATLLMLRHRLKHGVKIVRRYADDLPRVEARASELNQVWTNLIGNAIDAMGGSGTLELGLRAVGDDRVEVEVVDSGPGIPAEVRSRIFDPFFTTKPPGSGTGLGLHIARNIVVNRHRGRIDVESEPGRTRFVVQLPVRGGAEGGEGTARASS